MLQATGTSIFRVVDASENLLASGTLNVTPYAYGRPISGQVAAAGGGGLPGSVVMLLSMPDGRRLVAGAAITGIMAIITLPVRRARIT